MRFQRWFCSPTSIHLNSASVQWLHSGKLPAIYHHLLPACRDLLPSWQPCHLFSDNSQGEWIPRNNKASLLVFIFSVITTYWPHKHSAWYLINLINDFTNSTLLGDNISSLKSQANHGFNYFLCIHLALQFLSMMEVRLKWYSKASNTESWRSSRTWPPQEVRRTRRSISILFEPNEKQGPSTTALEKREEELWSPMVQTF